MPRDALTLYPWFHGFGWCLVEGYGNGEQCRPMCRWCHEEGLQAPCYVKSPFHFWYNSADEHNDIQLCLLHGHVTKYWKASCLSVSYFTSQRSLRSSPLDGVACWSHFSVCSIHNRPSLLPASPCGTHW